MRFSQLTQRIAGDGAAAWDIHYRALAKREQGEPLFTHLEKLIFSAVVTGASLAAYGLYSGLLAL